VGGVCGGGGGGGGGGFGGVGEKGGGLVGGVGGFGGWLGRLVGGGGLGGGFFCVGGYLEANALQERTREKKGGKVVREEWGVLQKGNCVGDRRIASMVKRRRNTKLRGE